METHPSALTPRTKHSVHVRGRWRRRIMVITRDSKGGSLPQCDVTDVARALRTEFLLERISRTGSILKGADAQGQNAGLSSVSSIRQRSISMRPLDWNRSLLVGMSPSHRPSLPSMRTSLLRRPRRNVHKRSGKAVHQVQVVNSKRRSSFVASFWSTPRICHTEP